MKLQVQEIENYCAPGRQDAEAVEKFEYSRLCGL